MITSRYICVFTVVNRCCCTHARCCRSCCCWVQLVVDHGSLGACLPGPVTLTLIRPTAGSSRSAATACCLPLNSKRALWPILLLNMAAAIVGKLASHSATDCCYQQQQQRQASYKQTVGALQLFVPVVHSLSTESGCSRSRRLITVIHSIQCCSTVWPWSCGNI